MGSDFGGSERAAGAGGGDLPGAAEKAGRRLREPAPAENRHIFAGQRPGAIGYGLLWSLGAPELLVATFAAGLAAIVIFTGINLIWKISLHTAFLAGAAAILIIVYGALAAWTLTLLPPVAWARVALKQHSALQVAAGAFVAAAIVAGIFWGYGMIGR